MASSDTVCQAVWSKWSTTGHTPEARQGHTANVVTNRDGVSTVYVFGGVVGAHRVNTLIQLTTESKVWSMVEPLGDVPSPRCYHASFVHGGCVYVHGGETGGMSSSTLSRPSSATSTHGSTSVNTGTPPPIPTPPIADAPALNDGLYKFETETRMWQQITAGLSPFARKGHTIAVASLIPSLEPIKLTSTPTTDGTVTSKSVDARIPVAGMFGGCTVLSGKAWDDDVYTLPLDASGWRCMWSKVLKPLPAVSGMSGMMGQTITNALVWPTARQGHTLTPVSPSKLVLFGGIDATGVMLNDVHVLELDDVQLSSGVSHSHHGGKVKLGGKSPWTRVACSGRPPIPRYKHTAVFMPDVPGKRPPTLLLYGGSATQYDKVHYPVDVFALDLASNCWSQLVIGYAYPSPRCGHTMVTVPHITPSSSSSTLSSSLRPYVLVFGGVNSMYCTNDVWKLRLRRKRTRFYSTIQRHVDTVITTSTATGKPLTLVTPMIPTPHTGHTDTSYGLLDDGGGSRSHTGVDGVGVGTDSDVDSGSDDEDWIVHDDSRRDGHATGETGFDTTTMTVDTGMTPMSSDGMIDSRGVSYGIVPWRGGDGQRGLQTHATLTDTMQTRHDDVTGLAISTLQAEVFQLKKDFIKCREQHAAELTRRMKCEHEIEALRGTVTALQSQLETQRLTFNADKQKLASECDAKVSVAEAKANQAVSDLTVVCRLLALHDTMAELRLDGWRAHAERLKQSVHDITPTQPQPHSQSHQQNTLQPQHPPRVSSSSSLSASQQDRSATTSVEPGSSSVIRKPSTNRIRSSSKLVSGSSISDTDGNGEHDDDDDDDYGEAKTLMSLDDAVLSDRM